MGEDLELAERLADEFAGRFRRGERPSIREYTDRLPLGQLGDFRILREVGRGGMGIVYEAEQVSLGRHVALKVLAKEMFGKTKHRLRFEREARTAAKLHHTNIVPVFGVGEDDGLGYYVMSGTLQPLVAESEDLKIRRREDLTLAHDWLIPEILRREAERLILSPDEPLP